MAFRTYLPVAASALAYIIITAYLGRDVLANLGSTIANDAGDPLLTAAILKWNATHVPFTDAWYQFPIFFPTRDTLTFSEHLLGLSVIASPIYWITGNALATYNLTLLLTFPLCALAMYALVSRLTNNAGAAFAAGLAFAFSPYRVSQLPHIQMLGTFGAPLALLGLHAYLQDRRPRWLVLYGVAWLVQGASNGYALVFFSVLVGLWTLWFVVARRDWRTCFAISATTVVAALPLIPVLLRYRSVHAYHGFVRSVAEMRVFSADIAALLCAPQQLTFWGWLRVTCGPEGELFPGVVLIVLSLVGFVWMLTRYNTTGQTMTARILTGIRRLMLVVTAVYAVVIIIVSVSGPFRFGLGPLRVSAGDAGKPLLIAMASLTVALLLSSGVREALRRSSVIGFYLLTAFVTWMLALGPVMTLMGTPRRSGLYSWLMVLPGLDGLRVPARFWLMALICLCVAAGVILSEIMRGRSRRVATIIASVVSLALLTDGWIARIVAAPGPSQVPRPDLLRGQVVFEVPADPTSRDIGAVYRAVDGGWTTVNGYSGWGPSYYNSLTAAGRAEVDAMLTPFVQDRDLHVLVSPDAPRIESIVVREPGSTKVASNHAFHHYTLARRGRIALARPAGERLTVHGVESLCSTTIVPLAADRDETTLWVCALWDGRQAITFDLGTVRDVGSFVYGLGGFHWLFPLNLTLETSEDGSTWASAWSGGVLEQLIAGSMLNPRRASVTLAIAPRRARFLRLGADPWSPDMQWGIAEVEVWSSSEESR